MTCKECGQVVKLARTMNKCFHTELSSHEGTRCQFNGGPGAIKLGIDVHQDFYVVVEQMGGSNPKPPQRFQKEAFLHWAGRLKEKSGAEVHAVYEACGFGFSLQRKLSALSINCYVVCPQKLDERNKRVKTDGLDAKALCLKLDRFVQGNRDALAIVRVPTEEEEQLRAIHRQREQLVKARKQLEAQGRSLLVNHGIEPVKNWWKPRATGAARKKAIVAVARQLAVDLWRIHTGRLSAESLGLSN
jgi:Transposase